MVSEIKIFLDSPLIIENGTFSWNGQEQILSAINITVEKNQLVAVVGNVGSGNRPYQIWHIFEIEKAGMRKRQGRSSTERGFCCFFFLF